MNTLRGDSTYQYLLERVNKLKEVEDYNWVEDVSDALYEGKITVGESLILMTIYESIIRDI